MDPQTLIYFKELINITRIKSIEFLNMFLENYQKTGEFVSLTPQKPSTNNIISDPCVDPIGGIVDPSNSSYYIAGLIAIVVVCTITTVLIALDQNKVEWVRENPAVTK
jgi:hypothetical protein